MVLVAGLSVTAVRSKDGAAVATRSGAKPGPVVLVPGYGGGTDALDALAARLRAAGHQATVLRLVGDGTGDLEVQAKKLKQTVDGLLAGGAESVDVVGYSAGGVVTRIWAGELGGAAQARRIVLLGSPNHGTHLAGLGVLLGGDTCPKACQQLAPGSDLLARLDADRDAPAGPQWVSIWTTLDEVVTPPDSARLAGAADLTVQSVCADSQTGHGQLPTDAAVQGLVVRALATPLWTTPTPADCPAVRSP